MKVVGIIAEYNPFHNGHKYQIEELKKRTGADYCVVVMSGNFLQRGVPALCSKYERARMALSCGVDLVLELPVLWATASAELFARGAVQTLANTGVVTHLGFSAETDDLELLQSISSILNEEPDDYVFALRKELRKGASFPAARKQALLATLDEYDADYLEEVLSSPNNILAIEYLKALPEDITPVLVQRKGAGYHDTSLNQELPSASAIREALTCTTPDYAALEKAMPQEAFLILKECIEKNAIVHPADISDLIGYRLLTFHKHEFSLYADCSEELANAIKNHLADYRDLASFCQELKCKNYTYTRISRTLLHMLLGIKDHDIASGREEEYAPYLRTLGFRKDASELLAAIKKEAQSPLITKVADYPSLFRYTTHYMVEQDLHTSAIYHQILTTKKGQPPANDYTSQLVIL